MEGGGAARKEESWGGGREEWESGVREGVGPRQRGRPGLGGLQGMAGVHPETGTVGGRRNWCRISAQKSPWG